MSSCRRKEVISLKQTELDISENLIRVKLLVGLESQNPHEVTWQKQLPTRLFKFS